MTVPRRLFADRRLLLRYGGLHAVAVPVCDPNGEVIAAMSVSGPSYRLSRKRAREIVADLAAAAAETGSGISPSAHERDPRGVAWHGVWQRTHRRCPRSAYPGSHLELAADAERMAPIVEAFLTAEGSPA